MYVQYECLFFSRNWGYVSDEDVYACVHVCSRKWEYTCAGTLVSHSSTDMPVQWLIIRTSPVTLAAEERVMVAFFQLVSGMGQGESFLTNSH